VEYATRGYQVYAGLRHLSTQQASLQNQLEQMLLANNAALARIQAIQLDVNCEVDIETMTRNLTAQAGRVDVLINNAGFGAMGALLDIEPETLALQFATNVMAPVRITHALLPLLSQANQQPLSTGRSALVVNIGSVSGLLTTPFSGAYCASKAAVHSISDALRMELRPFSINVACLRPGSIASAFGDNSEEQAKRSLPQGSLYLSLEAAILKRARASQNNPTSSAEFARQAFLALDKKRPASVTYIGNSSWIMPRLRRWLPDRVLDYVLCRMFNLQTAIAIPTSKVKPASAETAC
jgi:short-subunit dehydrogenase